MITDLQLVTFNEQTVPLNISFSGDTNEPIYMTGDPLIDTNSATISGFTGPTINAADEANSGTDIFTCNTMKIDGVKLTWTQTIQVPCDSILLNGNNMPIRLTHGFDTSIIPITITATKTGSVVVNSSSKSPVAWNRTDGTFPISVTGNIQIQGEYQFTDNGENLSLTNASGQSVVVTVTLPFSVPYTVDSSACIVRAPASYKGSINLTKAAPTFALPKSSTQIQGIAIGNINAADIPSLSVSQIQALSNSQIQALTADQVKAMSFEQLYAIIGDQTKAAIFAYNAAAKNALSDSQTVIRVNTLNNRINFTGNGNTNIGLKFSHTIKSNFFTRPGFMGWVWGLKNSCSLTFQSIKGSVVAAGNTIQFGPSGNNVKLIVQSGGELVFNPKDITGFQEQDSSSFKVDDFSSVSIYKKLLKVQITGLVINNITINCLELDVSWISTGISTKAICLDESVTYQYNNNA